mmetsp:Transcript_6390/g.14026  ORF Transcript_6390/g.14026 Transcript_6390/m.14026 type:complete len:107 (-) Transcript_6390:7-327(-)
MYVSNTFPCWSGLGLPMMLFASSRVGVVLTQYSFAHGLQDLSQFTELPISGNDAMAHIRTSEQPICGHYHAQALNALAAPSGAAAACHCWALIQYLALTRVNMAAT